MPLKIRSVYLEITFHPSVNLLSELRKNGRRWLGGISKETVRRKRGNQRRLSFIAFGNDQNWSRSYEYFPFSFLLFIPSTTTRIFCLSFLFVLDLPSNSSAGFEFQIRTRRSCELYYREKRRRRRSSSRMKYLSSALRHWERSISKSYFLRPIPETRRRCGNNLIFSFPQ